MSEGSILMTCANAKWIYENCGAKTTVEIVENFDISSDIKVEDINRIADNAYRDPTDNVQNNNVSQYNQTQAETEAVTNDDRPQETEAQTQKNDSRETQPTTVSQQETTAQSSEAQKPYDKTVSE